MVLSPVGWQITTESAHIRRQHHLLILVLVPLRDYQCGCNRANPAHEDRVRGVVEWEARALGADFHSIAGQKALKKEVYVCTTSRLGCTRRRRD